VFRGYPPEARQAMKTVIRMERRAVSGRHRNALSSAWH
jgi:hypothetical protein